VVGSCRWRLCFDGTGSNESSHTRAISSDSSSSSRVRFTCSFGGARQSFSQCPFLPQLSQVPQSSLPPELFFFLCPHDRLLDPPLLEPSLEVLSPCRFPIMRACHYSSVSSSLPPNVGASSSSSPRPSTSLKRPVISSIDMVEM
jgi:hypothetical protein